MSDWLILALAIIIAAVLIFSLTILLDHRRKMIELKRLERPFMQQLFGNKEGTDA